MYVSKDRKSDGNLLDSVGCDHNVDGIGYGMDNVLVLAETELIVLSVVAVFWIWYQKNVDNTDGFSCCYEIEGFFQSPVFSR